MTYLYFFFIVNVCFLTYISIVTEVMAKPQLESDPVPIKEINKLEKPVMKDSEVQPPNPVPPESHSNEKIPVIFPKNEDLLPKVDIVESISHPKNVVTKINGEKLVNGVIKSEVEENIAKPDKIEQPKEEKVQANQQKIDMIKQQQLIETIKQHGQEQKELIKEQKEILDELLKTKKELQQNKKEIDSNEAKKIAVESIQKIASAAIQSLSGVSNKPEVKDEKQEKPAENIANEAVNQIAIEAKKTLDAIQQMDKKNNVQVEKEKVVKDTLNSVPELPQRETIVKDALPLSNMLPKENPIKENSKLKDVNIQSVKREVPDNKLEVNNSEQKPKQEVKIPPIIVENKQKSVAVNENKLDMPKAHSHLPDEPKSYREGEDTQINAIPEGKPNIGVQNVPSIIKSEEKEQINNEPIKNKQGNAIHFKSDDILSNIANGNVIPRRKREVVDCTEETSLKPEDKQICENLINVPVEVKAQKLLSPNDKVNSQEILLPNVNLGDVGLSNSLHGIALHMRSLKSIQEDEKR